MEVAGPVLLLTLVLMTTTIYLAVYNKSKRLPLPPGPPGWPIIGNLLQLGPRPHRALSSLSHRYGPLLHLRLGRSHLVVAASASVAAEILRTHDANFLDRPPNAGATHMAYGGRSISFTPYGPRWRLLRRLASHHLSSAKALDASRALRSQEVAALVSALASAADGVEVGEWVNACVAGAMTRALLGRRMFGGGGVAVSGEAREFKEMVVEVTRLAGAVVVGDFLPALRWLDLGGVVAEMKALARRFDAFLDRVVEEHVRARKHHHGGEKTEDEDMLSVLLSLKQDEDNNATEGDGEKLTYQEIKASLLDMFIAGTDTSSSTVEWALTELIRHPDILHKAQQELDTVVGRSRLVSELDLPNLPYIQAIVKETFRLHPSTPLSLPRIAAEACDINGYHVPKGTTLMINVWAITRDPSTWADPLEFRPGRFLPGGDHTHVDVRGNDFELIPFGAGRRICAGLVLGLRMVQFLTAALVHAFDWALPAGQDLEKLNMEEAYGLTLQRAVPLKACPRPRLSLHVYDNTLSE